MKTLRKSKPGLNGPLTIKREEKDFHGNMSYYKCLSWIFSVLKASYGIKMLVIIIKLHLIFKYIQHDQVEEDTSKLHFLCVIVGISVQKSCAFMVEQCTLNAGEKPFHSWTKPKTRHFTNRNSLFRNPNEFRSPNKLRSHSLFRIPVQEP